MSVCYNFFPPSRTTSTYPGKSTKHPSAEGPGRYLDSDNDTEKLNFIYRFACFIYV